VEALFSKAVILLLEKHLTYKLDINRPADTYRQRTE